ncbi:hypothetical protein K6U06_24340 [Acidiferrimicrobium sp. IK]|uniref:DUF3592 domain-containing protein n=1 Tax=Acidiferrimicrobium sp. IK TaxID=2871700 RepID=UPI0021CB9322|nr:DUF3592 domain-containing protein [Acidiferrimicrobium sp. IK]MCU4187509.1 hypothetical protein [Acidiferrimicrobium sp. IK]
MTGAVALAIVLVIAVAGMSLAMQTQRPVQSPPRPQGAGPRRVRERRPSPTPPPPPPPRPADPEPEWKGPELLRTGAKAEAKVVSVVDERTLGPVTRSRLVLGLSVGGQEWEVTVRHAFQTPDSRSKVKVGGTVPVRYNPDDHTKVVLDPDREGGS